MATVTTGSYDTKSLFVALNNLLLGSTLDPLLVEMWNLKLPPKINIFLRRLFRNRLPSGDNFAIRNMGGGGHCFTCPFCGIHDESMAHTLLWCPCAVDMLVEGDNLIPFIFQFKLQFACELYM